MDSGMFTGGEQRLQPQHPGTAPRAGNAGIGAGNRSYAPGAVQGINGPGLPPPPDARVVAPPQAQGQATTPRMAGGMAAGGSPQGGGMGAPIGMGMDPSAMIMFQARQRAQRLIDDLIQRANRSQAMRQQGGGY